MSFNLFMWIMNLMIKLAFFIEIYKYFRHFFTTLKICETGNVTTLFFISQWFRRVRMVGRSRTTRQKTVRLQSSVNPPRGIPWHDCDSMAYDGNPSSIKESPYKLKSIWWKQDDSELLIPLLRTIMDVISRKRSSRWPETKPGISSPTRKL